MPLHLLLGVPILLLLLLGRRGKHARRGRLLCHARVLGLGCTGGCARTEMLVLGRNRSCECVAPGRVNVQAPVENARKRLAHVSTI